MTIETGTMLATHYRVVRVIGEGGMGIVVEAVHEITERRVAIKWLLPHIASNPEAAARLLNEATAACRSRHPNVIEIHDVIRDGGATLLIMELLEGESLRQAMERGKLPTGELLERLIPAMRGVAEAHRQGVIHRDIHPANIFFSRSTRPGLSVTKVLDFGICKLEKPTRDNLTRTGTTMGIPMYMSYEQLTDARSVDGRTDVYSFGVVLYEALSGRAPYEGHSYAEIAIAMINQRPVPLLTLSADIPEPLARIVERAMAHERDARTASLDQLADELTEYLARQGGAALPSRGITGLSERDIQTLPVRSAPRPHRGTRRRTWLGVALAGALLSVAAFAVHTLGGSVWETRQVVPELPALEARAALPAPLPVLAPAAEPAVVPALPDPELPFGRDLADARAESEPAAAMTTRGKSVIAPASDTSHAVPSAAVDEPSMEQALQRGETRRHRASKRELDPKDFR